MSNSRKKTKIFGHACTSEKEDKRINNRMFRRKQQVVSGEIEKELLTSKHLWFTERDEDIIETTYPINMNEIRSTWSMSKDGKGYRKEATEKDMRK